MKKRTLYLIAVMLSTTNFCFGQILREAKMDDSSVKEVIIWLNDASEQPNFKYIEKVKTGDVSFARTAPFDKQLNKLMVKTVKDGGNVLQVTSTNNYKGRGSEKYSMKGQAYSIDRGVFEGIRNNIATERDKRLKNCAYLTIYRVKNGDFSDFSGINVSVNDTGSHKLKAGTFYTMRITSPGTYLIKTKGAAYTVDVALGNEYYIKADVGNAPSPMAAGAGVVMVPIHNGVVTYFRSADPDRGAIECSLLHELK